jgi:hypothetical protein
MWIDPRLLACASGGVTSRDEGTRPIHINEHEMDDDPALGGGPVLERRGPDRDERAEDPCDRQ